jgi:hypothetical protein
MITLYEQNGIIFVIVTRYLRKKNNKKILAMKKYFLMLLVLTGLFTWGCTKIDTGSVDLKRTLDRNVNLINKALSTISSTSGYQMLSANAASLKSEISFEDSINLDLVAGIYDFQPDMYYHKDFFIPYRLFKKTGTSDSLIVNMPEKMVFRPRCLHEYSPSDDTDLTNNFTISASDYHLYYTWFNKYDYRLSAGFTLDDNDIGNLDVTSSAFRDSTWSYASTYTFTDGYNINVGFQTGDSTVKSFALSQDDMTLLKETRITKGTGFHDKERQYILSIGNIDIVRGTGIDSIQVFVDGVLQQKAGAKIVDDNGSDGSICHHRDILLTFDDGTTTNLSDLINPALETLRTLVDSLHSMNFATNIVDYIAISIYHYSKE